LQRQQSVVEIIKNLKNTFKSIDVRLLLTKGENNQICNFGVLRLSNKDQKDIEQNHKEILTISLKKHPKAEILFFYKSIKSVNGILSDLEEGRIKYRNYTFQLKDSKRFSIDSKVEKYLLNNNFNEYFSYISDESNCLITLEKQFGKSVFGCDNDILNTIFDEDLTKYACIVVRFPLYCLITKSDKKVKFMIHKNMVSRITLYIQGRGKNGRTIYEDLSLKNEVQIQDFNEYPIDLSKYDLDNSYEQKLLVIHSILNRIYEFRLNIPTMELQNLSELGDLSEPTHELKNNFLKFMSQFIDINIDKDTYYLKDNFHPIQIFPEQRNDLIRSNFNDRYYKNLVFQINLTWKFGLFLSTLILSRKLIENIIIELLRKKFPSGNEIDLYFNRKEGRFHDFSFLLENLHMKKDLFIPDSNEIDKIIQMAQPFRKGANSATHHPFENPDESNILKLKIPQIVESILRIYQKIISNGSMVTYKL
jgi:hypothetical protein